MDAIHSADTRLEADKERRSRHRIGASILAAVVVGLAGASPGLAANFSCPGGDVPCLISAINTANANGEANTIVLEPGTYLLTEADNEIVVDGETSGMDCLRLRVP